MRKRERALLADLCNPLDEDSNFRSEMSIVGIYRGDGHGMNVPLPQYLLERTGSDMRRQHEERRLNNTGTVDAASDVGVGIVDGKTAVDFDVDALA